MRTRMGNSGRNKYENEFTLKIFENQMKVVLEELATKVI